MAAVGVMLRRMRDQGVSQAEHNARHQNFRYHPLNFQERRTGLSVAPSPFTIARFHEVLKHA
jgi:hypothetical protein